MTQLVVIGASAGGIEVLQTVVASLDEQFGSPILVVVHVPEGYESVLPDILNRASKLKAVHAYSGQRIESGHIYVAPPNYHTVIIDDHIQLKNTPRENRHRPAIDALFRSAAQAHKDQVIGVILSGVLDDGTNGLLSIKKHNGTAIVQDPEDAMFSSMPASACRYVDVDYVLPADKIGSLLNELVSVPQAVGHAIADSPQDEIDITDSEEVMLHDLFDQPGKITPFACPECNGNLWVEEQNGFAQYWCHVGHRYTKRTLLKEKTLKAENILIETLRTLKESVVVANELIEEAESYDDHELVDYFSEERQLREKQLTLIQQIIEQD